MDFSDTQIINEKQSELPPRLTSPNLHFKYLPDYAAFLLQERLNPFANRQIELFRELKLPIMQNTEQVPQKEMIDVGLEKVSKMLEMLAANNASEFVEESVQSWLSDSLKLISSDQVSTEDIMGLSYIRRTLFRDFLTDYTDDRMLALRIMQELDQVLTTLDSISIKKIFKLHEDLYNQAQSIAKVGNWRLDYNSGKINWSDEMYNINDMVPGSVIESALGENNHMDDRSMVKMELGISRQTGNPFDFYYRIILKNGKVKILHSKGGVDMDASGKAKSMMGTVQDVTEQKESENNILAGKNFIQKIADLTPSIITVYQIPTKKNLFISDAIKIILGYDREEAMIESEDFFKSIIHPDDLPEVEEKNRIALEIANSDEPLPNNAFLSDTTYRMRHKNGQYLWFQTYEAIFSRNPNHSVKEVINISVDITEQVSNAMELEKKNQELAKSEERYHKMTEVVEDYVIILLDKNGCIENWNHGAEKIKGYKSEEIVGKHFRVFYSREDQENQLPERLLEIARIEGKSTYEGWRIRKNGECFWGFTVITALRDENNEIFGFSKVSRDLTEKREADMKLEKFAEDMQIKNMELQQSLKDLESFSYAASHDLQEPLRKIKTFTHFILNNNQEQLSDLSKNYFERIVSAADRMQHLIEALLQFSMIGTMTPEFEISDLNLILQEAEKDIFEIEAAKEATIKSDDLPKLRVIPEQLQQAFFNILSNSIKYRKLDEPLQVFVEYRWLDNCNLLAEPGQAHKISFIDNGIGFEQQYADKIFALFQRLHGKKEYPGTGIGLSICKKIMQNHHGHIEASGELGKGARFDIYLPA